MVGLVSAVAHSLTESGSVPTEVFGLLMWHWACLAALLGFKKQRASPVVQLGGWVVIFGGPTIGMSISSIGSTLLASPLFSSAISIGMDQTPGEIVLGLLRYLTVERFQAPCGMTHPPWVVSE